MNKIVKFIRNNILGFLVGLSLCLNGVILAENMISSNQVTYNGTTVKAKIDELVEAADMSDKIGNSDISGIVNGTITGAISTLNSNLSGKQATITGGATTITGSNLTANRALISNGSGKVAVSAVTSTELGYIDGVTSNVQTQINTINSKLSGISTSANKITITRKTGSFTATGRHLIDLGATKNIFGLSAYINSGAIAIPCAIHAQRYLCFNLEVVTSVENTVTYEYFEYSIQ